MDGVPYLLLVENTMQQQTMLRVRANEVQEANLNAGPETGPHSNALFVEHIEPDVVKACARRGQGSQGRGRGWLC